jgi:hypothetical protein
MIAVQSALRLTQAPVGGPGSGNASLKNLGA